MSVSGRQLGTTSKGNNKKWEASWHYRETPKQKKIQKVLQASVHDQPSWKADNIHSAATNVAVEPAIFVDLASRWFAHDCAVGLTASN